MACAPCCTGGTDRPALERYRQARAGRPGTVHTAAGAALRGHRLSRIRGRRAARGAAGRLAAAAGLRPRRPASPKAVQLYRQGEINIVLNAEPYSFAHNYFEAHGPSVCAMALKIDDEASALARACAFGGQPYRGLIGPNERQIPAVRAPDGSLIYLLESGAPGRATTTSTSACTPSRQQALACSASITWPPHCRPRVWPAGCCLPQSVRLRGRRRAAAARSLRPDEVPRHAQSLRAGAAAAEHLAGPPHRDRSNAVQLPRRWRAPCGIRLRRHLRRGRTGAGGECRC